MTVLSSSNLMNKANSRKTEILDQAAHLFREKGYAASTLRGIAKKCGVKGGSIYYHFSSKQEILYQIMEQVMAELIYRVNEGIKTIVDPVEKIRMAVTIHIKYHVTNLDKTYVTDSEIRSLTVENYKRIIKQRRDYENIFQKILEEGVQVGFMGNIDVKMTAFAILQMCTGVSYWFKEEEPLAVDEIINRYFDFICWGIRGSTQQ